MTPESLTGEDSGAQPLSQEIPIAYRAVRGELWVALSSYWTIACGFAANIVLTRMLSSGAFVIFALAVFSHRAARSTMR